MADSVSIIIADDHPLFRTALTGMLNSSGNISTIHEAEDFPSLQSCVEKNNEADLILLDLHMPGAEGFSSLVFLMAHYPHIPVVIISAHEEAEIIRRALDHGANGFLPKSASPEQIGEAIETVLEGGVWAPDNISNQPGAAEEELNTADALASLTPQQFRVANMVSQGLLNKQIAYELDVTEATIKAHMTEIFKKLGVHSRTQVAVVLNQLAVNPSQSLEDFKS